MELYNSADGKVTTQPEYSLTGLIVLFALAWGVYTIISDYQAIIQRFDEATQSINASLDSETLDTGSATNHQSIRLMIDNPTSGTVTFTLNDQEFVIPAYGTKRTTMPVGDIVFSDCEGTFTLTPSPDTMLTFINPTRSLYLSQSVFYGNDEAFEQAKKQHLLQTTYICIGGKKYFGHNMEYFTGLVWDGDWQYTPDNQSPNTHPLDGEPYRMFLELSRAQDIVANNPDAKMDDDCVNDTGK